MVHHAGTPHIHVRLRDFLDMLWCLTATGKVRGFGISSGEVRGFGISFGEVCGFGDAWGVSP